MIAAKEVDMDNGESEGERHCIYKRNQLFQFPFRKGCNK